MGASGPDSAEIETLKNEIMVTNERLDELQRENEILKEKKIDPKKVSLKVLSPLIEFSSLEEEELLQDKWANLITHILNSDTDIVFQQNCIAILNKISSTEANLVDNLYADLQKKRIERYERAIEHNKKYSEKGYKLEILKPDEYPLEYFVFNINKQVKYN